MEIPTGDVHDFDFLAGRWRVANRRLRERWVDSDAWEEFPGTSRCEPRLGGVVNVDEIVFPTMGFTGLTVRAFDLAQRRWSIYWINSTGGVLLPPVSGGFGGDRGAFYGADIDEGRAIEARFLWTRLGRDAAHWEQAFSIDGASWETNWVMDLTRAV